jgi:polar amino acid transport system ATP-binding protein
LLANQQVFGVSGKEVVMTERVILKINHLHKAFGDHVILNDFNLEVQQGEIVVVIGPSGCGKSTLLRCINALEDIQSGEILLDGISVRKNSKNVSVMRQKIGMVFQSYDLFPHKTVLDNILLAPLKVQKRSRSEAEQEALELLEKVGLADRGNDYPRQLSGGQKQRIAIVRALIMHPEILLLDEITAALDPEMVHEVLKVVLSLAENDRTMIIVTHEMAFAKAIADRILFLEHGEIAEESRNPREFFAHPETERAQKFLQSFEY